MSWTSYLRDAASVETERVKLQVRDAVRSLVLAMVAGVLLLVAVVFALTGAYASLSEQMPAWQAGGAVALGTLALCLFLLLLSKSRGSRRPPGRAPRGRARSPTAEDLEATAEMGAAASDAARDFVSEHRPSGLQLTLAAFIAGMVASRRSRRRGGR